MLRLTCRTLGFGDMRPEIGKPEPVDLGPRRVIHKVNILRYKTIMFKWKKGIRERKTCGWGFRGAKSDGMPVPVTLRDNLHTTVSLSSQMLKAGRKHQRIKGVFGGRGIRDRVLSGDWNSMHAHVEAAALRFLGTADIVVPRH